MKRLLLESALLPALTHCQAGIVATGIELDHSVPAGRLETRYLDVYSKLRGGFYSKLRWEETTYLRPGSTTIDQSVQLGAGGRIARNIDFELFGSTRLSGSRVPPWFGAEMRWVQSPLVWRVGFRHYDGLTPVSHSRLGVEFYWGKLRLDAEAIVPSRYGSAVRVVLDCYYDDRGSAAGFFILGPTHNNDGGFGAVSSPSSFITGVRVIHYFQESIGLSIALQVAPIRSLGVGLVVRF